jgi:tail-anchored protein insertion receptor
MRRELVRLDAELRATSAQDDFAKWARLRRKLDKMQEEHKAFSSYTTHAWLGRR